MVHSSIVVIAVDMAAVGRSKAIICKYFGAALVNIGNFHLFIGGLVVGCCRLFLEKKDKTLCNNNHTQKGIQKTHGM